jgi:hypothetical protein
MGNHALTQFAEKAEKAEKAEINTGSSHGRDLSLGVSRYLLAKV